jgi:hypothetical protein
VLEADGERIGYKRKSGTGAGEPAGHRLRPSYSLFPAPEGGEKTRLGGELQREEQLLYWTGTCMDRLGTVVDLSEGFFRMPFPPSSGTTGVAQEQRSSTSYSTSTNLTSLDNQRPRTGWSMPRIVENSDTFFSYCMHTKNI